MMVRIAVSMSVDEFKCSKKITFLSHLYMRRCRFLPLTKYNPPSLSDYSITDITFLWSTLLALRLGIVSNSLFSDFIGRI